MASLPSFVQLMASLALSDPQLSEPGPSTEPQRTDSNIKSAPSRSVSSPALREAAVRQYSSRYSPYSPVVSCHSRKSSHSSTSSLSDAECSPRDQIFRSSSMLRPRRYRHKVSRNDSSSDIAGDTPISIYVRRGTPSSSPITPNFDSGYESAASQLQTPVSIPTLPILLTNSANSDPESPTSDCDGQTEKDQDYYRFILQRTGTRISAARAARREQVARRYALLRN